MQSQLSGLSIAIWCRIASCKPVWTMVRPARSLRVVFLASIASSYSPTHTIDNVADQRTLRDGKGGYQQEIKTPHLRVAHGAFSRLCVSVQQSSSSLPVVLAHKSFFKCAVFEIAHKVVATVRVASPRPSSPGTACALWRAIRWRWVVCR